MNSSYGKTIQKDVNEEFKFLNKEKKESFIINKERGICPNEFSDVEDGSWIISVKIENEDVWNKICSGEVKGFSIETEMIASAFSNQKQKAKELGISVDQLIKIFSIFK